MLAPVSRVLEGAEASLPRSPATVVWRREERSCTWVRAGDPDQRRAQFHEILLHENSVKFSPCEYICHDLPDSTVFLRRRLRSLRPTPVAALSPAALWARARCLESSREALLSPEVVRFSAK